MHIDLFNSHETKQHRLTKKIHFALLPVHILNSGLYAPSLTPPQNPRTCTGMSCQKNIIVIAIIRILLAKHSSINSCSVMIRNTTDFLDSPRGSITYYVCCNCNSGLMTLMINPTCSNCQHRACGSCFYDKRGKGRLISKPHPASPNPRSQRVEEDEKLSRLGYLENSSQKLLQTSDTAAQTQRKKDSRVTYPEDVQQAKSDTPPLPRPAGATDAVLISSFSSGNVHQKSPSHLNETLSNVRSDSSTTTHAALLADDDSVSRIEALQLEERYLHAYYLHQVA